MPAERDPRVGDVYRKGKRVRYVMGRPELRGPWVSFETPSDRRVGSFQAERLDVFVKWAKGAEVIHRAE